MKRGHTLSSRLRRNRTVQFEAKITGRMRMIRMLRWLEAVFAAFTMLLSVCCLLLQSDVTSGLEFLGFEMLTALCCLLTFLARIVVALLHSKGERFRAFISQSAIPLWTLGVVVVCLALIEVEVPSQLRFALSRDELEAAVANAREEWWTGEEGRWIGLYKVQGIKLDSEGQAYLDLGGCGMLDRCWLMYASRPDSPRNRQAVLRLSDRWWLVQDPF